MNKRFAAFLLSLVLISGIFSGCGAKNVQQPQPGTESSAEGEILDAEVVVFGQEYSDLLSVSAYLYEWEQLPPNYWLGFRQR